MYAVVVDLDGANCQYLPEALWGKGKGLLGNPPRPVTLGFPSRWCLPYFPVGLRRLPYHTLDHLPMPLVCGGSVFVPTSLSLSCYIPGTGDAAAGDLHHVPG
jgi:hypothetical protein